MIKPAATLASRLLLAFRALRGDFDSAARAEEAPAAPGGEGALERLNRLSEREIAQRAGEAPLAEWAERNRPQAPTARGLSEWLDLRESSPNAFANPSSALREALRLCDPDGDYFVNGMRLAQEEIEPEWSALWMAGHQAWLQATRGNPAERVIDSLVFLRSDGDELRFLTALLRAPSLDWSALPVQSWARLCRNLPSLLYRLASAGMSEQDWIKRGWEQEDLPAAKEFLEELSRTSWPMDRLFSAAEVKWLRANFRKNGLAAPDVDALLGSKTLWEILCATRELCYAPSYKAAGYGVFADAPLDQLLERIRASYEASQLGSATGGSASARPPPAESSRL